MGIKKFVYLIIAVILSFSNITASAGQSEYSDISTHWAKLSIEKWSNYGIILGDDGAFRPDDPITRGEFAVVLNRIMNYQTVADNKFEDLDDNFSKESILKLAYKDIMIGFEGKIRPMDEITRQEAATMLCRAFYIDGSPDFHKKFDDDGLVDNFAKPYLASFVNNGIIKGCDNYLNPKEYITRAETVKIIDNIIGVFINKETVFSGNTDKLFIINSGNVKISNLKINNNLIITEGVGENVIELENVTVTGKLIALCNEKSSIILKKCSIANIESVSQTAIKISEEKLPSKEPAKTTSPTPAPLQTPTPEINYGGSDTVDIDTLKDKPVIITSLKNGITQKDSKLVFDVMAKDTSDKKIACTVKFNDNVITPTWGDDTKTSYTLDFILTGENKIEISATDKNNFTKILDFKINYMPAEYGEVVGNAILCVEAFTVGGGYIVSPVNVEIKEGLNLAYLLDEVLSSNGLEYNNTGGLDSGFYLSKVKKINNFIPKIPQSVKKPLLENGISFDEMDFTPAELGEFDFSQGSGWMYCINGNFPNVGISDCYIHDGDVIRVQYTMAYGADIGGTSSMGYDFATDYYDSINRDELTKRVAKGEILNYAQYMDIITKPDMTQEEMDELLEKIMRVDLNGGKHCENF